MNMTLRRVVPALLGLLAGMLTPAYTSAETIHVAAANSTCSALQQLGKLFEQRSGHHIICQCKSSGLLAKGLKGGAISADIYISASKDWMDFMTDAGMIKVAQVKSPWGNELVVATAKSSPLALSGWAELATPKVKTILIGDPGLTPLGRYAKEAMQHSAIWEQTKTKVVTKKHMTLLADILAESDGSTIGIMFRSNVTASHRVLFKVDETWHTPIRYYAAPLNSATQRAIVMEFLRFLLSKDAQMIFAAEGFRVYAP